MTTDTDNQPLLDECKTIAENCLYTAQTHFIMQEKAGSKSLWLILIPSGIAAIAGMLTSIGLPGWIGVFATLSGVITGVATYCKIDQKEISHKTAANLLTSLRHEARSVYETYWKDMTHEQLSNEVRRLGDKYSTLCQALITTDKDSYEEARKLLKSGTFVPDFREHEEAQK